MRQSNFAIYGKVIQNLKNYFRVEIMALQCSRTCVGEDE